MEQVINCEDRKCLNTTLECIDGCAWWYLRLEMLPTKKPSISTCETVWTKRRSLHFQLECIVHNWKTQDYLMERDAIEEMRDHATNA